MTSNKRILILALTGLFSFSALGALSYKVASGSLISNDNTTLTFSSPVRNRLVVTNLTSGTVYYKLNDNTTTPTTSATSYHFALTQNTRQDFYQDELRELPVTSIGVFCATTTPTTTIFGW